MSGLKKLYPLLLVLFVVIAYSNSFSGIFLLDDYSSISIYDQEMKSTGRITMFKMTPRCIGDMTFKLNYLADGLKPASYHLVNLCIHLISVLLVYGILRRTIEMFRDGNYLKENADTYAFAVALLWGVHPLTTQAVTYICQRYESLAGMFVLLALYSFIRAYGRYPVRSFADISIISCILGLGVKEYVAATPFIILAYDYIFMSRLSRDPVKNRWLYHVCMFLAIAVLFLFQLPSFAAGYQTANFHSKTILVNLLTQSEVILHYIKLAFVPVGLCFDYGWPAAHPSFLSYTRLSLISLMALIVFAAVVYRKAIGFPGLWFVLILGGTSSFIPIADAAFEHRMYLPLISLIVILTAVIFFSLKKMCISEKGILLVIISTASLLMLFTFQRNNVYSSELGMWEDVAGKRPLNMRAQNEFARLLAEAGMYNQAIKQYSRVISCIPAEYRSRLDSGKVKVYDNFITASYEYNYFVACANMGSLYFNNKKDVNNAIICYAKALRIAPHNIQLRCNLKNVFAYKGVGQAKLDEEIARLLLNGTGGYK